MRTSIIALVAFSVAAPAAAMEAVALLPATGVNVSEAHLAAATEVLRVQLGQSGRYFVVMVPSPAAAGLEATPAQAAEAARGVGAQLAVSVRVARLAGSASARLAAYRPDGGVVRIEALSALQPDDLDPVLKRLASGLATGATTGQVVEPETVRAREPQPIRRSPSELLFGMRYGVLAPDRGSSASGRHRTLSGAGVFWLFDAGSFLADVSLGLHASNVDPDVHPDLAAGIGLGVYYPLVRAEIEPYVGAGLEYRWSRLEGATGSGLSTRAVGGLMLARSSLVVVRAEAGWFQDLYSQHDPATGAEHRARGPFASIGISTKY